MKVTKCPSAHDSSLEYDQCQFNYRSTRRKLLTLMDRADAERIQVVKYTKYPKKIPDWVLDKKLFSKMILGRPYSKAKLNKWLKIIYLYYTCDYRAKDVAEEMGMSLGAIEKVLQRLNRQNVRNSKDI